MFKFYWLFKNIKKIHFLSFIIACSSLAILFGTKWIKNILSKRKKFKWIRLFPEILLVVVLGIGVTAAGHLNHKGVAVLGHYSGDVPKVQLPDLTTSTISSLIQPALVISIIGFIESVVTAKTFADRHGYSISPNRELVALGLSNIVGSFFGSIPCFGSLARSSVNDKAGAKTLASSFLSSCIILFTIGLLLPLFRLLPQAVMASIIMMAALGLVEVHDIKFLVTISAWTDLLLVFITFTITIFLDITVGLFVSIFLSIFLVVKHGSNPVVTILGRLSNTDKVQHFQRSIIQDELIHYISPLFLQFHDIAVIRDINIFDEKHNFFSGSPLFADKGILVLRIETALYFVNIETVHIISFNLSPFLK